MKKIFIILALAFSWFTNVSAQREKLYSLFDKYQETEGVTSIKIAKPMFSMLSKLDIKDAELDNIKPVLDKIQGLRILVIEKPEMDSLNKNLSTAMLNFNALQKEISGSLKNLNYEELITVNSKDNKIKFLASDASNGVLDNLLLSVNSEGNTVLMMLDGKISMNDVNNLANEAQKSSSHNVKNYDGESATASSEITEETRKVGSFRGIDVSSGIKLTFTQDGKQNITVKTDADKQQYVKTEVENGVLKVFVKNNDRKTLRFSKINVDVAAPKINLITVSSGANFTGMNTINEDFFEVSSSSGSNITADLVAKGLVDVSATSGSSMKLNINSGKVQVTASSGSNATLAGNADSAAFQVSSGATVNAQDLVTKSSTAAATSAAALKVNASEDLTATASSGANIRYRKNLKSAPNVNTSSGGSVKSF